MKKLKKPIMRRCPACGQLYYSRRPLKHHNKACWWKDQGWFGRLMWRRWWRNK